MSTWSEFAERMHALRDLSGVIGLLTWDQETYMPAKAAQGRSEQLATMQALYHEKISAPRLGELVEALQAQGDLQPVQAASVRILAQERARAVKLPARLVKEIAQAQSLAVEAWKQAKGEKRFAHFAPHVARLIDLRKEQADAWGHAGERYDALLDAYEPGMTTARLEPLFSSLRARLVPLVQAIAGSGRRPDRRFIEDNRWDVEQQWAFTLFLLREMGFDLEAGRQDRSAHPFTGGANRTDVRLTTRLFDDLPFSAVFSSLHEGGHGLYEQGFAPGLHRTFASSAPSMGLHESQSRLWENLVGRSLPFWRHYLPALRAHFPQALDGVALEQLHAAINQVEPSFIRVEADEVTYNLHILLRFELELALMRGDLKPVDLPGAWNEKMRAFLGLTPPDDALGVLQDIHWAWGEFGYFPTYTLGNLYSVCILEAAERAMPDLWRDVEAGKLTGLRDWLRKEIHGHGYLWPAEELVKRVAGQGLTEAPFMAYLWKKYGPLYGIKQPAR